MSTVLVILIILVIGLGALAVALAEEEPDVVGSDVIEDVLISEEDGDA